MAQGTLYILLSYAVFTLSGYALHAFLGRSLGTELYGIFGVLAAFLFLVERLFIGSFARGVTKLIAERDGASGSIISYALKIQLIFCLVVFLVFCVGARGMAELAGDPFLARYFRLLTLPIMASAFHLTYSAALNGARAFGKQAVLLAFYSITRPAFVVFLVTAGFSLDGAIGGLALSGIASLLLARYYCRHLTGKASFRKKDLLGYSMTVVAFTFATLLIMNVDLILVKTILRDRLATGLYTADLSLARTPTAIAFPIAVVLFPLIAKSVSDGDRELALRYLSRTLRYLLLLCLPLAFVISATSRELITLVYGNSYSDASPALSILIFGLTFITISVVMNTAILAACKLSVLVTFNFFLVTMDVILNCIFIPKFGILGASVATTLTASAGCLFSVAYVFRHFRLPIPLRTMANALLASAVIYLLAIKYVLPGILLFPCYVLLCAIYAAILLILKEFDATDMDALSHLPLVRRGLNWAARR